MKYHTTQSRVGNIREDIEDRKNYIGGSDVGVIMGVNPYKSAFTLWSEKVGIIEPEKIDDKEAVWWGRMTEELIAKRFCEKTGKRVQRSTMAYGIRELPFMRGHVDRLVMKESAGLECKSTDSWKFNYENAEVPPWHYWQCMAYMAMTGRKRWYLATHQGNSKFHIVTISRDEQKIDEMLDACTEFWTLVENGTPPEIDDSESTADTLALMYPEEYAGKVVNLEPQEDTLIALLELQSQEKELKNLKTKYQNEIKAVLGDAERGETVQFTVSWKANTKGSRVFRMVEKPL
jgi:putative phage-type endonuclease